MEQQDQGQTKQHWPPGPDIRSDKAVVAEMLKNFDSPHWKMCLERVRYLVNINTKISPDLKEDVTQKVVYKIINSLQTYEGKGRLIGWISTVVRNHVIDEMRIYKRNKLKEIFFSELGGNNGGEEGNTFDPLDPRTTEEKAVTNENLDETTSLLIDFAEREAIRNPRLFRHIKEFLILIFLKGVSLEEAAREYGIDNPHYLRRKARAYLRKMGLSLDNDQG